MNLTSFLEGDGVQDFLDALRRNWQEEIMEDVVGESE
jgi:peptide chain release factor 1